MSTGKGADGAVRVLHTSDWHLGRSFGDHSLLSDQAAFVDWLVELTRAEGVHVVAIAGDLHDRSLPPVEAVSLLAEALKRLRDAGARVVAIAGNHDSGTRVAAYDGLVDASGVWLRGGYGAAGRVIELATPAGPLAVAAVPFLDPLLAPAADRDAIRAAAGAGEPGAEEEPARRRRLDHADVQAWAMGAARAALPAGLPSLALAHAFVAGGAVSDSERELSVGTAGQVPADLFEGFDYVALGHLHRPQRVAGQERLRYSGSPLAYSFSEEHAKEVVIAELAPGRPVTTRAVPVDVGRGVRTLRGRFEELGAADRIDGAWVRVELTDPGPVIDAHRRLRERFPGLVEIARVRDPAAAPAERAALERSDVDERTPIELATRFWEHVTGAEPSEAERDLLADALARADGDAGA